MIEESTTKEWAPVLRRAIERSLARTWVSIPAKIEKFDPATGLADCTPLLREIRTGQDGNDTEVQMAIIPGVPVMMFGGSKFRIRVPVEVGTLVDLLFSDLNLDEWKASGDIVTPLNQTRHDNKGAIAILGLRSAIAPWVGPDDRMVLGADGGDCQVAIGDALVELGYPSATQAAMLTNLFITNLNTLLSNLITQLGGCGSPAGASAAAAAFTTAVGTFFATSYASTKVKVAP